VLRALVSPVLWPVGTSVPLRKSERLASVEAAGGACRSPVVATFVSAPARSFEAAFVPFTNRCSTGSNVIPDAPPLGAIAAPELEPPADMERTTRVGAATLADSVGKTSRDEFLKFFHLSVSET